MPTSTSFDVTILGGGLAGRLCAWQLAQTGVPPARIALVERGPRDGSGAAAYVAAAMLAPLAEAAVADRFVVDLGLASLEKKDNPKPRKRIKSIKKQKTEAKNPLTGE